MTRRFSVGRGDDQGAIAVIVALVFTAITVLAAFAVDIGNAYAQARQLSVAADAAALAAAAKVGEVMPLGKACTSEALDALTDNAGHVGAQAIAQAVATSINDENAPTGSSPAPTVAVDCVKITDTDNAANAIQVTVNNSRQVKTYLAGIIGIDHLDPNSYAVARYFRVPTSGGLRPWAACVNTVLAAQADPTQTFWTGIDWMPAGTTGPCSTTAAGNWGAVDFNGGNNSATDLANWTMYGYPGQVDIPNPNLPADPGVSNKSELQTAFQNLVGQVVLFPAVTGFTCNNSNTCNGSNASFNTVGIATVQVCGIVYGNNTYNIDNTTGQVSNCWVNPSPPSNVNTVTQTYTPKTVGDIAAGSTAITIDQTIFPAPPLPGNVSIAITIPKAAGNKGSKDLVTTIPSVTTTTDGVLQSAPTVAVKSGTQVSITITTTTGTGGFGPYVYSGNKWNLQNHIQFRWVNYTTSSYQGSSQNACDLAQNDNTKMCAGVTQLWK